MPGGRQSYSLLLQLEGANSQGFVGKPLSFFRLESEAMTGQNHPAPLRLRGTDGTSLQRLVRIGGTIAKSLDRIKAKNLNPEWKSLVFSSFGNG